MLDYPYLGFGLGLRAIHYRDILNHLPKQINWFEILTENYLAPGGIERDVLSQIREHYPVVMHGVSLSIASTDSLDENYLKQVKSLADFIQPAWISDHLCWAGVNGKHAHDLLPMPYTEEAIVHIVERIQRVQDFLGRRILLENLSSYVNFASSTMQEWEFLREITIRADSLILLDINNIYVSAFNHKFNPFTYIDAMPAERVQQYHLAGHDNQGDYIIDTHDHDVIPPVWELYEYTLKRIGQRSTMIERDDRIPPLNDLLDELDIAKKIMARTLNINEESVA